MKRGNRGFSLIELLFVIVIGGVLAGVAMSGFGNVRDVMAARSAKTSFMTMHQQARAMAVERGETIFIVVYTTQDRIVFYTPSGGFFDPVFFRDEFGVDIRTSIGGVTTNFSYYMCMTPRGYADVNCGSYAALGYAATMGTNEFDVEFWVGTNSDAVTVLPLGQLVDG
jgi:prepilin-type N-terminal cleavage/methylation domain-containing protein